MKKLKRLLTTLILFAVVSGFAYAAAPTAEAEATSKPAIQLGAPFCDNMVLQRDMEVTVWGWSKPGTKLTVEFAPRPGSGQAGQKQTAKAGKDGKWTVELKKLKASFEPAEMIITESGGKKIALKNILVGEVWMASGQSNMQWKAGKCNVGALVGKLPAKAEGTVAPIREFEVTSTTAQLFPIEKATGSWKDGTYSDYSAIALAFAQMLYKELNVPIGILNCSWSSTQIEAWVPREGWATGEDEYSKSVHEKCLVSDPATKQHKEAWGAFYASLEEQIAESDALIKNGGEAKAISAEVPGNMRSNRDASWLFNGRMSPVVPFAIRGAIWNQGWHNRGQGITYYSNLHSMIRGWRAVWDTPDLPVYFHQFYCPDKTDQPGFNSTSEMRLGTVMARDIPNTGMASQIDIGGAIHYRAKTVPGRRLALHALKNQYPSTELRAGGKAKDIVADGPIFKSYTVKGDKVVVSFDCAESGLVVGDTAYNRAGPKANEGATGFADPTVIENGEEKVKLFWLAGEDRVWHRAAFEIKGDTVVVKSDAVKKPRGISYGSGGIGFQPCLYNGAMLPMTPFIQYDNEMVASANWPDEELKIVDKDADPAAEPAPVVEGKLHVYRKMPLLSTQFRDDAVLQADKPVTIWGSTRNYGEMQAGPEEGDCKVHFQFGDIKKVISVTPEMAEWSVTLPAMKAGSKPYTLKVSFTIDGELAHERVVTGIVFGDVWYVGAPSLPKRVNWKMPEVKPSGQIVRMIENQSKRDGMNRLSRFSVCVSRTPRVKQPNGKWSNRYASYWKDAHGLAATIGNTISAKTGRPVGIIFMQTRSGVPIKNWLAVDFLDKSPRLMEDYKTVGSQYRDNPHYLTNVRRYVSDWKQLWEQHVPAMIATKAVPDGSSWGVIPSPQPNVGDSKATWTYNVYTHSFGPIALSGIIFLSGEAMVADDEGANFGTEMSVLASCFKSKFDAEDIPFIYTLPSKTLAPKVTTPKVEGKSTAIEIGEWADVSSVIQEAVR